MAILIIGENKNSELVVVASHSDESLPEVATLVDVLDLYPEAQKILFVKVEPSRPPVDPENPSEIEVLVDPEPSFTAAEILFNKLRRRLRKIRKAQLVILENGQSGSAEFQKQVVAGGEVLVARIMYDYPMPVDETNPIDITNPGQTNCSGTTVTREHDSGFEITTTADGPGKVVVTFDWAKTFIE